MRILELFELEERCFLFSLLISLDIIQGSGDLRQGSSNNSVTNFVQGFSLHISKRKQPSFEDLLLVVLVILRRRFPARFRPKVSLFNFAISEQYFRFSI